MTVRRSMLLIMLSALIGGYAGYLIASRNSLWLDQELQITGLQSGKMVQLPLTMDGNQFAPITTRPAEQAEENFSPALCMLDCNIAKYHVDLLGEGIERARVLISDLSPVQLRCLLSLASTELEGAQPPGAWSQNQEPRHRPLSIALETIRTHAQTH